MVTPFAAIISKKRRHIINAFRKAGATSAENAKPIKELGLSQSLLLHIQKLRGVLVEVPPNRYYLDEIRERKVERFRRIFLTVFVVIVIILIWYFTTSLSMY